MEEFKIGDYVEVGFGENRHDNEGFSIYFRMDVEGYNEFDIEEFLESEGNILYKEYFKIIFRISILKYI